MTNSPPQSVASSRWPHRLAVVMACATFPLIWVGGLVTTYDAGMAVPDWPSTYGYNMFLYPLTTWWSAPWDLFIEHGHRLLASGVGLLTIGFVAAVWRSGASKRLKVYSLICLALVIAQGILGGMRVLLDANVLARLHGCLGPLFFVSTVGAVAFTSRWWSKPDATAIDPKLVRLFGLTTLLAYLQLVVGAHLRHLTPTWSPQVFKSIVIAHLFIAAVLFFHAANAWWMSRGQSPAIRWGGRVLFALVTTQIMLGAGVWRVKYYWPTWLPQPDWLGSYTVAAESMAQTITVTAHVAMGSLILAAGAYLTARASRCGLPGITLQRTSSSSANSTVKLEVVT